MRNTVRHFRPRGPGLVRRLRASKGRRCPGRSAGRRGAARGFGLLCSPHRGGYPGGSRQGAGRGPDARRHRRVHLVGGRRPVVHPRSPDDFGFGLRDVRRLRRQLFGRIRRRTTSDRVLPSNPRCRRLGDVRRRRERDSGVQGRPYAAGGPESPERRAGSRPGAKGRSAATLGAPEHRFVRRWDGDVPKPHRNPTEQRARRV